VPLKNAKRGEPIVRLPRSRPGTTGVSGDFCTILLRVAGDAKNGWHFEGKIHSPGRKIALCELWPTPDYPPTPICLESTIDHDRDRGQGRGRFQNLHIVHRFDRASLAWHELARVSSGYDSRDWTDHIGHIARQSLLASRGGIDLPEVLPDVQPLHDRITSFLDAEFSKFKPRDRCRALDMLWMTLARRLASEQSRWSQAALDAAGTEQAATIDPFELEDHRERN
jgi:hypothetical protein